MVRRELLYRFLCTFWMVSPSSPYPFRQDDIDSYMDLMFFSLKTGGPIVQYLREQWTGWKTGDVFKTSDFEKMLVEMNANFISTLSNDFVQAYHLRIQASFFSICVYAKYFNQSYNPYGQGERGVRESDWNTAWDTSYPATDWSKVGWSGQLPITKNSDGVYGVVISRVMTVFKSSTGSIRIYSAQPVRIGLSCGLNAARIPLSTIPEASISTHTTYSPTAPEIAWAVNCSGSLVQNSDLSTWDGSIQEVSFSGFSKPSYSALASTVPNGSSATLVEKAFLKFNPQPDDAFALDWSKGYLSLGNADKVWWDRLPPVVDVVEEPGDNNPPL